MEVSLVKTDVFSEQQSIDFLREKYNHIITDFYFPLGRKTYKNENGEVKVRFVPVLQGMFFIRVQNERRLKKVLSPYGYFMYKGFEMEPHTSELVERTFFTKAHILTADSKQMSLDEIVRQSKIPDEDMETFVYFNDRIGDDINGLSIVEKRYSDSPVLWLVGLALSSKSSIRVRKIVIFWCALETTTVSVSPISASMPCR